MIELIARFIYEPSTFVQDYYFYKLKEKTFYKFSSKYFRLDFDKNRSFPLYDISYHIIILLEKN